MFGVGIVEGFFGPEWTWESRYHLCDNLPSYGGQFYIYAPKRDSFLRKNWTQNHSVETWNKLKKLSSRCHNNRVAFGIGLSPFEVHATWNQQTKNLLREKIRTLHELNVSYLGLFFDDMKGAPDLAEKQIKIVEYVQSVTDRAVLFCPTYYSDDPILDKVFGQRPTDYLEKVGTLPEKIQIFWTGNKVISKTIAPAELDDVAKVLRRKPFVWDNYFANDGPKQCKFLKLQPLGGRSKAAYQRSTGWAFNLMNQSMVSEVLFASSVPVLRDGANPSDSFQQELRKAAGEHLELIERHRTAFVDVGLDGLDQQLKDEITSSLVPAGSLKEIIDWVNGKYLVGPECLTD